MGYNLICINLYLKGKCTALETSETSLVAQWVGVCLPVGGHRFSPRSGRAPGAAEQPGLCTTTAEAALQGPWAPASAVKAEGCAPRDWALQQEKPPEKPAHCSPQLEKPAQSIEDSAQPKNNNTKKSKKNILLKKKTVKNQNLNVCFQKLEKKKQMQS